MLKEDRLTFECCHLSDNCSSLLHVTVPSLSLNLAVRMGEYNLTMQIIICPWPLALSTIFKVVSSMAITFVVCKLADVIVTTVLPMIKVVATIPVSQTI